jgi:hypothetical protein
VVEGGRGRERGEKTLEKRGEEEVWREKGMEEEEEEEEVHSWLLASETGTHFSGTGTRFRETVTHFSETGTR